MKDLPRALRNFERFCLLFSSSFHLPNNKSAPKAAPQAMRKIKRIFMLFKWLVVTNYN